VRPLRVLHLVANRWWTGSADPALDLARALARRGHDIRFGCIPGDALEARVRAAGLVPEPDVDLERTARPWRLLAAVRSLRALARRAALDVVHTHQSHDHWLAALALAGSRVALIRSVHHRRGLRGGPAGRWLFRRTDAVLAVSEAIRAAAGAVGVVPARVHLVPGAVDVERFTPAAEGGPVRAELGLGDRPVVGYVSRIKPGRGHERFLAAVDRLRGRVPALRAVLVGRGEGRPAVEALVRRLGLAETVVFAGYRDRDLPAVLAAMDCLVLLAAGSEESCRAVLEAMAVGRPVVAGRVGALPETVLDGQTGWLVGDAPDEIAARVGSLFADPAAARRMGGAARQRVVDRHTPARRAETVEAIYRAVVPAGS
jgi:glycosyltransferase involved in cell wall biosynthesis